MLNDFYKPLQLRQLYEVVSLFEIAFFVVDTTNLKCIEFISNLSWEVKNIHDISFYDNGGFLKSIHFEDRVALITKIDNTPEKQKSFVDFRVLDSENNLKWVRFLFNKYSNIEGKYCEGFIVDISQEKKQILDLESKCEDFIKILENSFDSFYYLVPFYNAKNEIIDFTIELVNLATLNYLKMNKEDLLGQKICEIFPINLKDGFFENYKKCFETQKIATYEYEVSTEYSNPGWYEQHIIPLRNGVGVFTKNLTFKKKTETELSESLAYIEAINNSIPGIIFVINIETDEILYVNKGVKTILGYSSWTFFDVGLHFILNLIHPEDKNFCLQEINRIKTKLFNSQLSNDTTFILEYRMSTIDGEWKYFRNFISRFRLADERKLILMISLEITKEQEIKKQLFQREKDFESILNNMPDLIVKFDTQGYCIYINKAINYLFNISEKEIIGKNINELPISLKNRKAIIEAFSKVLQNKTRYDLVLEFELKEELKHFQARLIPELDEISQVKDILLILWDVTEIKNAEKQLYQNIFHDSLTNLTNRKYFLAKLEEAISKVTEQTSFGIMFIDVDRFQELNDSLGHVVADKLLKAISERIAKVIPEDTIFSRLGGDEFAILIKAAPNVIKTFLASIALEIINQFTDSFKIDEIEIYTSVSIGIVVYPNDGRDSLTLLKNADQAMYYGRQKEYSSFTFYTPSMGEESQRKRKVTQAIRKSLEKSEFELFYQPKVDVRQKKIVGAEALIRWKNAEYRSPDMFMPVAEDSGLIIPLGEWIIQQAVHDLKYLDKKRISDISIAVNLSAKQFQISKLPKYIFDLLTMYSIPHERLEIEITEGVAMKNVSQTEYILRELSYGGIRISIDDFGTGYSSLAYLKKFPIDYLKIDKVFIKDIPENKESCAIVNAVISMAEGLEIKTIAEGVETREQLEYLLKRRCYIIQGYYFQKPLPLDDFIDYVNHFSCDIDLENFTVPVL